MLYRTICIGTIYAMRKVLTETKYNQCSIQYAVSMYFERTLSYYYIPSYCLTDIDLFGWGNAFMDIYIYIDDRILDMIVHIDISHVDISEKKNKQLIHCMNMYIYYILYTNR